MELLGDEMLWKLLENFTTATYTGLYSQGKKPIVIFTNICLIIPENKNFVDHIFNKERLFLFTPDFPGKFINQIPDKMTGKACHIIPKAPDFIFNQNACNGTDDQDQFIKHKTEKIIIHGNNIFFNSFDKTKP